MFFQHFWHAGSWGACPSISDCQVICAWSELQLREVTLLTCSFMSSVITPTGFFCQKDYCAKSARSYRGHRDLLHMGSCTFPGGAVQKSQHQVTNMNFTFLRTAPVRRKLASLSTKNHSFFSWVWHLILGQEQKIHAQKRHNVPFTHLHSEQTAELLISLFWVSPLSGSSSRQRIFAQAVDCTVGWNQKNRLSKARTDLKSLRIQFKLFRIFRIRLRLAPQFKIASEKGKMRRWGFYPEPMINQKAERWRFTINEN